MRQLICIIIMLLPAAGVLAQNPVTADVSSQRVTANEIFNITITANGSDVQEPDMQAVRDAGIQLGAPSQQSSTSIRSINGKTSVVQSRTWRYPASVATEGSVTIPRISVKVDGREYLTQPMTITVTNKIDLGSRGQDPAAELTVDDLAFVRAITDKTVVYQGEPIVLRLRLYSLDQYYVSVESPRALPLPETQGFYAGAQWQQNVSEQVNGHTYRIMEISQALYPAMPGELTISPWEWQGVVRWYDARRRPQTAARMFATNAVKITVMPLPPQPPNFSGAVGKFNMSTHLSEETLTQGKPVRLIVTISGDGNPNTIGTPTMPDIPWAHVSEPETEVRQQENNTDSTKLFSYLITPLESGEQVIPPVEFTFFAPMLKNYKTDRSNEIRVTVQPAKEGSSFVAIGGSAEEERHKIDVFDGDMLPIITDPEAVANSAPAYHRRLGFFALTSPVMFAILLIGIQMFLSQRRRLVFDRGYARRYYAKNICIKALSDAKEAADPSEGLYRAITAFIGDMLNINGAGLTPAEIESLLHTRNVDPEIVALASRTLKACERARYAGRESSREDVDALCSAATDLVEKLHEILKEQQP